ncbi:MAG TPA: NUDIX domain-containing protein [candidate division Zixibacteria bacterium]|nr:NUDIX domain-containing protein [candidate division Zixibacteria bacterium]
MDIGRFTCGIGVLIWDAISDKYLVLKRSEEKDFAAGFWECVTGRVDQGEGFEDAAHREVLEELSVSVQLLQILGTTHFYRGEQRPEYELIGVVYLGTIAPPGNIAISVEHSEYRWESAEEAKNLIENNEGTEGWLARVIDRAEVMKSSLPSSLLELFRDTGFELDP